MKHKSCGGCKHFTKLKNMVGNSGVCQVLDTRTDEDKGHDCSRYSPVPFHRTPSSQVAREIQDALGDDDDNDGDE